MQCPNCHKEIPDNSKFCLECGAPLKGGAAEGVMNTASGAIAATGGIAAGAGGAAIGSVQGNVIINPPTPSPKALSLPEALRSYLDNLIAAHQHLRLQAIRTDQPLGVSLEKVYISLTAIDQQRRAEQADALQHAGSGALTIGAALRRYRRLVIIGDPGGGDDPGRE